jgi:hypothetical protein
MEVAGQKGQGKGKSFWQDHYKLMCGSIPEVVHTSIFDRPPQRRSQNVQMSYIDIAKGRESPVKTQTQNKNSDDASVDTTVISNISRQENTNMSGLSAVMAFPSRRSEWRKLTNKGMNLRQINKEWMTVSAA